MATQNYGITPAGFIGKQQNTIITEINSLLQGIFGPNANLAPEAVLGQLVGIFSEREALLWQLLEAIYNSQYPAGAEGTSVDNILALTNLRRLPATATKTAPTSTSGVPGLEFFGTPGTVIPKGAIITVNGTPTLQFTVDANVTIAAATNAVQLLSAYGGTPTSGYYDLSFVDAAGNDLTLVDIPFNANAVLTQISFSAAPATSTSFTLTLNLAGATLTTGAIACGPAYPTAAAIQAAIRSLAGYSGVTVTGAAGAYNINWGAIPMPHVGVGSNSTGATIAILDSIQAMINNLQDPFASNYPLTDVTITGTYAPYPSGFTITFGANTPVSGQPSSGAQPQNNFTIPVNTLTGALGTIGLNCVTTTVGSVPMGTGSATCTQAGPNFVAAGFLTVIGSSVTGWNSVTNPLDCITGTNLESDTDALVRRATLLASNANGPLQAIVEKVSKVAGVAQVLGFQNLGLAAQQIVSFGAVPTAGQFFLTLTNLLGTQSTGPIPWNALATNQQILFSAVPTGGTWSLTLGGNTVSAIPYNIVASSLQALIQAQVSGYSTATVTGNFASGFIIGNGLNPQLVLSVNNGSLAGGSATAVNSVQAMLNALNGYAQMTVTGSYVGQAFTLSFNGSNGGQPQGLFQATNALTGAGSVTVAYGLPGACVQIIVNDNNGEASNADIAQAIFDSKPGGIQTFGSISNNVQDQYGNVYQINFSRPTQVPIYVSISLVTDLTTKVVPEFNVGSLTTIQDDVVEIGAQFGIGGTIIGMGSNGLIGAFNSVPGITNYTLTFGLSPNPTNTQPIPLSSTQSPQFETYFVQVSYQ